MNPNDPVFQAPELDQEKIEQWKTEELRCGCVYRVHTNVHHRELKSECHSHLNWSRNERYKVKSCGCVKDLVTHHMRLECRGCAHQNAFMKLIRAFLGNR